jgi:hypothetical protein
MDNKHTDFNTYSFLFAVGWLLIALKVVGMITVTWMAIAYYFILLGLVGAGFFLFALLFGVIYAVLHQED